MELRPLSLTQRRINRSFTTGLLFCSTVLFLRVAPAQLPASATPASAASFKSLKGVDGIFALVPASLNLRTGGAWNIVAIDQANEAVGTQAINQQAKIRLRVEEFEPYKDNGFAYRIKMPDGQINVHGAYVSYRIWVYFKGDQVGALAKVRKGDKISVSGKVSRCDLKMYDGKPFLTVDLADTKVEPPTDE